MQAQEESLNKREAEFKKVCEKRAEELELAGVRLSAREEQMSQREAKIGPLPARALALSLSLYTALLFTRVFVYVDGLYVCRAARWSVYVLLYDVAARRQRW